MKREFSLDFGLLIVVFGLPIHFLNWVFINLQFQYQTHFLARKLSERVLYLADFFLFYNVVLLVFTFLLLRFTGLNRVTLYVPRIRGIFVFLGFIFSVGLLFLDLGVGPRSDLVSSSPFILVFSWLLTIIPCLIYINNGFSLSLYFFISLCSSMLANHQLGGFGGVVKPLLLLIFVIISRNFSFFKMFRFGLLILFLLLSEPLIFGNFSGFVFDIFTKSYFDRYLNSLLFYAAFLDSELTLSIENFFSFVPFARYFLEFESTRDVFNLHFASNRYIDGFSFPLLYSVEFLVYFNIFAPFLTIFFAAVFVRILSFLGRFRYYNIGIIVVLYCLSNLPFLLSGYVETFYKSLFLGFVCSMVFLVVSICLQIVRGGFPKKFRGRYR